MPNDILEMDLDDCIIEFERSKITDLLDRGLLIEHAEDHISIPEVGRSWTHEEVRNLLEAIV